MALLTTAAERRAVKNRKGFDGYKFTAYTGLLIFYINWSEGDQERQTKIYSDTGGKIRLIDIGNEEEAQQEEKNAPNFERVEVEPGTVQIIDYTEKSFAIIGDTKPIKDTLKNLGGKFNFRLSCGAGWVFPKTKLQEVQSALS